MAYRSDAAGGRRTAGQSWVLRKRQCIVTCRPGRTGAGRRMWVEVTRGLGHDTRSHRQQSVGGGRDGCSDPDSHGHAERIRVSREHAGRIQGPYYSRFSHRRGGRRTCPGHHPSLWRTERNPIVNESHKAVHDQHFGRAPGHAHGVPPLGPQGTGGRSLRREPDSAGDDGGRGHSARYRGAFDYCLG